MRLKLLIMQVLKLRPVRCWGLSANPVVGKSTIAMSVLGLLKFPAEIKDGSIQIKNMDVLSIKKSHMHLIRGKKIAYIPQNAMNILNPVIPVGRQIVEAILIHQKIKKTDAEQKMIELLELVGIPACRANSYNHELSGGMKQRIVIAMAIAK